MNNYLANIEELTILNTNFRKVLFTGQNSQLVVMSLLPNEDIGMEIHDSTDQFIRIESGEGKVVLNGDAHSLSDGMAIVINAGTEHNIINTSDTKALKLYTIYSPAHHKDGTVHVTKNDALKDDEDHL